VILEHYAATSVPITNSTVTAKVDTPAMVGVGCTNDKKTLSAFVMIISVLKS
jgi:ABC-type proline/glycine betaine transport system substrate-binding protein